MKKLLSLVFAIAAIAATNTSYARSQDDVTPLLIGAQTPMASLVTAEGEEVELSKLLAGNRSVVIFYRGGWCPYCNRHFQELAEIEEQLVELGYQILAISPDSPENLSKTKTENNINYTLLSDSSLEAANGFGLVFTLGQNLIGKYASFGISLEKSSGGKNKNQLPVPAVFIIDEDREITFEYINPNYRKRVPGKVVLAAAESLID